MLVRPEKLAVLRCVYELPVSKRQITASHRCSSSFQCFTPTMSDSGLLMVVNFLCGRRAAYGSP